LGREKKKKRGNRPNIAASQAREEKEMQDKRKGRRTSALIAEGEKKRGWSNFLQNLKGKEWGKKS